MRGCLTCLLCCLLVLCLGVAAVYLDLLPGEFTSWVQRPGSSTKAPEQSEPSVQRPPDSLIRDIGEAEELSDLMAQAMKEYQTGLQVDVKLPNPDTDREEYLLSLVEEAYIHLRRNHPEIFWMSMGQYGIQWSTSADGGAVPLTVELNYCMTQAQADMMEAEMEAVVTEILAQAPADTYEAVKYFHDWIVDHTVYDVVVAETDIMEGNEQAYNIHGVFLEGKAVCEAYAKAFQLLCDRRGIPSLIVFGTSDGENHAWNYVQLEGSWYLVDCTADDPVSDRNILRWNYFLRGTESVLEDGKTIWDIYVTDGGDYPYLAPYDYDNGRGEGVDLYQEHQVYSVELQLAGPAREGQGITLPGVQVGNIVVEGTEQEYWYELSGSGADDARFRIDSEAGRLYVGDTPLQKGVYEVKVRVVGQQASAVATIRLEVV